MTGVIKKTSILFVAITTVFTISAQGARLTEPLLSKPFAKEVSFPENAVKKSVVQL
jgi:hypothetical protein